MLTPESVAEQLRQAGSAGDDFYVVSHDLTAKWKADPGAQVAIRPILEFMEADPDVDFGAPGALVHFMETFYGHGYEQEVIESVKRRPVAQTVWLLNRLINSEKEPTQRQSYLDFMKQVSVHPLATSDARENALYFLEFQSQG